MKVIKGIALGFLALFTLFVMLGLFGAFGNNASSADYQKREACRRSWEDAAPGAEKRMARQMCDALGVKP